MFLIKTIFANYNTEPYIIVFFYIQPFYVIEASNVKISNQYICYNLSELQ